MVHFGRKAGIAAVVALVAVGACSAEEEPQVSGSGASGSEVDVETTTTTAGLDTDGTTTTANTEAPAAEGWTQVELIDDDADGVFHRDNSIVTGIWFGDEEHGAVALHGDNQTSQEGGAVLAMSGPTTIEGFVVEGLGNGGDGQNTSFVGLFDTPEGLVAGQNFGGQLFVSTDEGRTFDIRPSSAAGTPNATQYWFSVDTNGFWHHMDSIGNVWFSFTAPGPEAEWIRTWQPEASPPEPVDPIPGACTCSFHQGYYAFDAQQSFWVSSDGLTMLYGSGYGVGAAGVCRSTDGGRSFFPVAFPDPPAASATDIPYVIVMLDDQRGFAARANELSDQSAYAYTTADGGATWTAATLPASVTAPGSRAAFVSGSCGAGTDRCYVVGFAGQPIQGLLLRSDDGGATWEDLSDGLAGFEDLSLGKLHTVFALGEDDVWIGGNRGFLAHSGSGGE